MGGQIYKLTYIVLCCVDHYTYADILLLIVRSQ
jgi:hypothetical protein